MKKCSGAAQEYRKKFHGIIRLVVWEAGKLYLLEHVSHLLGLVQQAARLLGQSEDHYLGRLEAY